MSAVRVSMGVSAIAGLVAILQHPYPVVLEHHRSSPASVTVGSMLITAHLRSAYMGLKSHGITIP